MIQGRDPDVLRREYAELEAALRDDAEGYRAAGGEKTDWILYIMGDCRPWPPFRAVQNLNLIASYVWRGKAGDSC